jgi:hypothetical protein
MKVNLTAAVTSALIAACVPRCVAAHCLEYGTNSLSGTLVRQTYPGPPDYESVTSGDKPLVIWVLALEYYICVADPTNRLPEERYEREIQLVLGDAQYEQYRNLLGKKVTVTGTLQHGYADFKRLLIVPREIARTRM